MCNYILHHRVSIYQRNTDNAIDSAMIMIMNAANVIVTNQTVYHSVRNVMHTAKSHTFQCHLTYHIIKESDYEFVCLSLTLVCVNFLTLSLSSTIFLPAVWFLSTSQYHQLILATVATYLLAFIMASE